MSVLDSYVWKESFVWFTYPEKIRLTKSDYLVRVKAAL